MSNYLRLQHNVWWYRRRVPGDLRGIIGKGELAVNLKSSSKSVALKRALALAAEHNAEWDRLRQSEGVLAEVSIQSPEDLLQAAQAIRQGLRSGAIEWPNDPDSMTPRELLEQSAETVLDSKYGPSAMDRDRHGVSPVLSEAEREILSGALDLITPDAGKRHLISEVLAEHVKYLRDVRQVREQTVATRVTYVNDFRSYAGDLFVDKVTRKQAMDYLKSELIPSGLSKKTIELRLQDLQTFWSFSIEHGYCRENPFKGLPKYVQSTGRGRRATQSKVWDSAHFSAFFDGIHSKRYDTQLRSLVIIGALTGMRLNEVCETVREDVHECYIHIPEAKTDSSIRDVPLCAAVRPLVKSLCDNAADGYLISGLRRGGADGKRGHMIGKSLGTVRQNAGLRGVVDHHQLRHTFISLLESQGIQPHVIELIVGHRRQGMSLGLYSKGVERDKLIGLVAGVRYPEEIQTVLDREIEGIIQGGEKVYNSVLHVRLSGMERLQLGELVAGVRYPDSDRAP